jgi:NTP pyrophosphatase (non-canonical NTP hydrolase)
MITTYREIDEKPEGFPSELADIMIRVMDLAEGMGVDLGKEILEKHEYNKTRPYKHGGKRA